VKTSKRKAIGAYYTRNDITVYIARATLLPWMLDQAAEDCPEAFNADGTIWQLLRNDPDRYIPGGVLHGVDRALPRDKTGPPPPQVGLATEAWPELIARRQRCRSLRQCLRGGAVVAVNELVTLNLDIRQLVHDLIDGDRGSDLAAAIARAAERVTVLDPTCGDGAFLLAAMEVLEDVRMANKERRKQLRRSIIERNLRGVDLMAQAIDDSKQALLGAFAVPNQSNGTLLRPPKLGKTIRQGNAVAGFDWPRAFPDIMRAGGFDVIIGNPPYLAADRVGYTARNFLTSDCPDVYAWVLEQAARLLKPGGRSGMIVPLSLAFGGYFQACRELLFTTYNNNWFASFGRIPSALFAFDIRVRNTIHLGHKWRAEVRDYPDARAPRLAQCYTTRLHRWFEAARPHLFALLEYSCFRAKCWQGRVPKVGNEQVAHALEDLLQRTTLRLGDSLAHRPTPHVLYFKKTAYNWLTFCRRLPPCFDAAGHVSEQTQFDTLYFHQGWQRDAALLLLNGKWAFVFWSIVGDDFHVARWTIADFPIDLQHLPVQARRQLVRLARRLECAMHQARSFKLNAGQRFGTYNLARCRHITDQGDRVLAKVMGLEKAWPEVELMHAQIVKTDFASSLAPVECGNIAAGGKSKSEIRSKFKAQK
jgi:hypothetical protein